MNVSTSALGVRRRKVTTQNIDDEENSAVLKLGPEFQLNQITNDGEEQQLIALNLSEARLLIRAALKERKHNKNKNKTRKKGGNNNNSSSISNSGGNKNRLNGNHNTNVGDINGGNGDSNIDGNNISNNNDKDINGDRQNKGNNDDNDDDDDDDDDDEDEDDEDMKEDEISNMELAGPNSNKIVHKTLNFLTNFARFKNRSSCETVEKLLNDFSEHCNEPLHPFELAQLGTLECEDPEEAKSLIPSLQNKVSDVQLQTLLTELRKYQTLS